MSTANESRLPGGSTGRTDPETGNFHPCPSRYFFDWSGKGIHVLPESANDGQLPSSGKDKTALGLVQFFTDFDELFAALPGPSILIGEATFESFVTSRREDVINEAARLGHTILSTPNRQTGRHRRGLGFPDEEKTDELDVYILRDLALNTRTHLRRPTVYYENSDVVRRRKAANNELMVLRNTPVKRPSTRSKRGFVVESAKDVFADEVAARLPDYGTLPAKRQVALGNGKEYSKLVIAAVAVATKNASNRASFERICGLFHHGYGSQIRSDLFMHRWSKQLRSGSKGRQAGLITLSEFRRELRWLYHQIKRTGSEAPEEGTSRPHASGFRSGSRVPVTGRAHPNE